MELVLYVASDKLEELKKKLLQDEEVSRASITFKEAKSLGYDKDGYFCYISGTEEVVKKAKELATNLATQEENQEEVIKKIKEEEEKAIEGFGGIFG